MKSFLKTKIYTISIIFSICLLIIITSNSFANNIYSTYLGGNSDDGFLGTKMAIDLNGFIYVVSFTESVDFPTTFDAYQPNLNHSKDIIVAKFDHQLNTLVAATYLGGSSDEFYPNVKINSLGQVVVTGYTFSSNFPVTPGCYDAYLYYGSSDMFVSILSNDLTTLISSTYLGGNGGEGPNFPPGLALTPDDEVCVSGVTNSTNFPTTLTAYKRNFGGAADLYITKFSSNLSTILASTYLGGINEENYPYLVIDQNGSIHVSVSTNSVDYPTTNNAYNRTYITGGFEDNAITKFDSNLETMQASTFIGSASSYALALDSLGNLYNTGHTSDPNYITTDGVYDRTHNGISEIFITKIDNKLENVIASTFLSGNSNGTGVGLDIIVDNSGHISLTGYSDDADPSSVLPTTSDAINRLYGGGLNDGYIAKLDNNLSLLEYATFIGGNDEDASCVIICDANNNLIVGGMTSSNNLWTSVNAYDTTYNGNSDCFMTKLQFNCCFSMRGNIDSDSLDTIDISDLVFLVAYMFQSGAEPLCLEEANIDGDAENVIDISDLVALVDFMFTSGPSPADCN